jgi:HEAT repeat protein
VMRVIPSSPQFTLKFALRLVLYCALVALCIRLYWQTRPSNRAAMMLRVADTWTNKQGQKDLAQLGPSTVPFLLDQLADDDSSVQVKALDALGKLPAEAARTVPAILAKLKDANLKVRLAAARALRKVGLDNRDAIRALVEASIENVDPSVRVAAIESLYAIAVRERFRTFRLEQPTDDSDPAVRRQLASALVNLAPLAQAAESWLIDALSDDDDQVRWSAVAALKRMGLQDRRAIPMLARVMKEPPRYMYGHRDVAVILGNLGVDAEEVVPALIEDLNNPRPVVRLAAAETLWRYFGQVETVVPTLVELLKCENAEIRAMAAEALGKIGPDAKSAIPALLDAIQDPSLLIEDVALDALKRIDPRAANVSH